MPAYEELERSPTPWGEITLIRRRVPGAAREVAHEVKLGEALLMSSLVTESERALARLALAPRAGAPTRVLVGGLGLGYTAVEALDTPGVREVEVVDLLPQVIRWHREGLVPLGARLTGDPRVRLVQADVFARLLAPPPPGAPLWDAVLLDVDHSPEALLRPEHGSFYAPDGLLAARRHLAPGGVLAVWSALGPEAGFVARLERVFARVKAESIAFWNPNNDADEVNGVYLAWPD
jgi:spermidine synthase